jgi:hypothetical protein
MENHDLDSMSADASIASDPVESATSAGDLEAVLQRSQQLNDYCDLAVAEIRASLERD